MAAMTFGSNAIEVPADVAEARIYVDLHDEVNNTPVHMVRLDLSEDQAVELATLLMLGATKLRGDRLERLEALNAAYAMPEAPAPAPAPAPARKLSPCYCDSVYHPQGC